MLEAYLPYFTSRYGAEAEFIVVINGSTDKTDQVVGEYAARHSCLRVIVEPLPVGKGGAVILGLKAALGDLIGFVDADGATPPAAFDDLVSKIGGSGGIIASRWIKGAQVSPRQPFDRRMASRFFNLLTRVMFGLKLNDTQCGAKLMTRQAVLDVLPHLGTTRWAFDVDLLFQLRRAGYAIREIPTAWHDVEGSKVQIGRASMEMILALTRLRLIYSPFKWVVELYNKIGPWLHPVGEVRDHLLTHSLILLIGSQFGNICNLLFQVLMARMMGNADYGVLFSVLSALMMLGMPLAALGGAVTHFTALCRSRGDNAAIRAMLMALMRDLAVPALAIVVLATFVGGWLAEHFKLGAPGTVLLAALTLPVMALSALSNGVLSGLQAFKWVAVIGNGWTLFRLVLGVILVALGCGALGGLSANLAGVLAAAVLTLMMCGSLLGRGDRGLKRPDGFYAYTGRYMAGTLAFGVLSSADVLLVKYYFSAEEAGVFAKAAMIARMVFFLPTPICSAMFPKVSSEGEASTASRRTLWKAMVITALLGGAVGLICVLMPTLLLRVLVNEVHPGQAAILRAMALVLAPLTMVMVIMSYEIAQRRFRVLVPLFICAGGYVLGVLRWHGSLLQVVGVLGVASVSALVLSLLFTQWRRSGGAA